MLTKIKKSKSIDNIKKNDILCGESSQIFDKINKKY